MTPDRGCEMGEFCDNCRHSEFDFNRDIELQCLRGHDLEFFPPPADTDLKTSREGRNWGWRRCIRDGRNVWGVHCRDYWPRPPE